MAGNVPLAPPSAVIAPYGSDSEHLPATGRGILHLRTPPKLARTPAPRRRPPPCAELPLLQWAIIVPPAPVVQYRAETPEPVNRLPETPEQFADADEDLRPLTRSLVDIMDQEEQAGTAVTSTAPVVSWAVGAPTVAATIPPTTTVTSAQGAPTPEPILDVVGERTVSPTVVASTPGASQPETVDVTVASSGVATALAATTITSQTNSRPVLRFSDIAYAIRLSRGGQADLIADSLMMGFQTARICSEIVFAVRSMYALLRDAGSFLRERVVLAHLSTEPAQRVLDDLAGLLDQFMGDDEHHQPA